MMWRYISLQYYIIIIIIIIITSLAKEVMFLVALVS